MRLRIAAEAARLLAETGGDPAIARRKAAERLGVRDASLLPSGDQIREALEAHRRLFPAAAVPDAALQRQREAALAAMDYFAAFSPRLVGPVLDGSADPRTPVCLHLHADDPGDIARRLLDRGIPASEGSLSVRLARDRRELRPAWRFEAEGVAFELVGLPAAALRQGPFDALDDAPMARASASAVRRLLGRAD